jgi:hypothetical protein
MLSLNAAEAPSAGPAGKDKARIRIASIHTAIDVFMVATSSRIFSTHL